jgi:hypothetical protein
LHFAVSHIFWQGVKKIRPELYSNFVNRAFGTQTVAKVQLLSMLKPKDASGYYHCCHQVDLSRECLYCTVGKAILFIPEVGEKPLTILL